MITVAFSEAKSDRDMIFPDTTSGSSKWGAFIPRGTITEGVSAIVFFLSTYHFRLHKTNITQRSQSRKEDKMFYPRISRINTNILILLFVK